MATLFLIFPLIPDAFWNGLFGFLVGAFTAGVTLLGVYLTNRHSRRVTDAQLVHDTSEASKVRKFELRRSLYLDLLGEYHLAIMHLGGIPSLDPTTTNLADGTRGFTVAAAKAGFVAGDEAGRQLGELSNLFGEAFFKVVELSMPIHDLKSSIDIHDALLQRANAEVNRILAAMAQLNESGRSEPGVFDTLQNSYNFQQKMVAEQNGLKLGYMEKRNRLLQEFAVRISEETVKLTRQQVIAFAALRAELELHGNVDAYREQMERTRERVGFARDRFLEAIAKGDAETSV